MADLENLDHKKDRVLSQVQHRSNPHKLNSVIPLFLIFPSLVFTFSYFSPGITHGPATVYVFSARVSAK